MGVEQIVDVSFSRPHQHWRRCRARHQRSRLVHVHVSSLTGRAGQFLLDTLNGFVKRQLVGRGFAMSSKEIIDRIMGQRRIERFQESC